MAFEVVIGYNSQLDCARELAKTSFHLEESNASFEVYCAYLWRHCDVFCGENPFFTLPKKLWFLFKKTWSGK